MAGLLAVSCIAWLDLIRLMAKIDLISIAEWYAFIVLARFEVIYFGNVQWRLSNHTGVTCPTCWASQSLCRLHGIPDGGTSL